MHRCFRYISQTVFSCRSSYGVVKGALEGLPLRWRCVRAVLLVNNSESETDLQKHIVKLTKEWKFCILAERCINYCFQDLQEPLGCPGCLLEPPGSLLGVSSEPPGRRALRDSPENTRTPYYGVFLWNAFIIRKNENPGLTDKSRFHNEKSSQIHFSTENLISSYGHCGHFGWSGLP